MMLQNRSRSFYTNTSRRLIGKNPRFRYRDSEIRIPNPQVLGVILAALFASLAVIGEADAGQGRKVAPDKPDASPLSLQSAQYFFRVDGQDDCLGEDDELEWEAAGSLAPGETFSFTPAVPGCNGHPAAISIVASWDAGSLELSSAVPDVDYASWDADQYGMPLTAHVVGTTSQLCMFPAFSASGENYTVTLTNRSNATVNGIRLNGRHQNDWSLFYYPRCLHADADGDGWNDSIEHTMANLVYPNGYIQGVFQPDLLWGTNYLRARAQTATDLDEIDSYPPDFNDDRVVDERDVDRVRAQLGKGNGIALEEISPNPGAAFYHDNTLPWRRFDLDGDGFVGVEDVRIVEQSMSASPSTGFDQVSPTARILGPLTGQTVDKGSYQLIQGHVWDNAAIRSVDYRVNGRTVCFIADPVPGFGFTSPYYQCWWKVPKGGSSHTVEIRVTDQSGNVTDSSPVTVSAG